MRKRKKQFAEEWHMQDGSALCVKFVQLVHL